MLESVVKLRPPGDAPLRCRRVPPASQGLSGKQQVAGALPAALAVLTPGPSWLRRKGRPGIGQQLGIIVFGVETQDILHVGRASALPSGRRAGQPAGADSSGRGPREPGYRPGRSDRLPPGRPALGTSGPGAGLSVSCPTRPRKNGAGCGTRCPRPHPGLGPPLEWIVPWLFSAGCGPGPQPSCLNTSRHGPCTPTGRPHRASAGPQISLRPHTHLTATSIAQKFAFPVNYQRRHKTKLDPVPARVQSRRHTGDCNGRM